MAEKVEISANYLSSVERGKENPTLSTLLKLSEALGVEMSDVFHQIEIEDPERRKALLVSLLDKADEDQLKMAYRVLSAIIR